jgi:hypothetical protein
MATFRLEVASWITHPQQWNKWRFMAGLIPGARPRCAALNYFLRSELWIALLGPSIEEGIVGLGPTIEAALRAFDAQYLAGVRPSVKAIGTVGALRQRDAAARPAQ